MGRAFDYVANSRDGVFAVDDRQSIVLWNRGATRILGHHARDVLGKACHTILRGRDAAECGICRRDCDAILAARRLDLPPTIDMLVRTRQGQDTWINLSTIVVPSRSQKLSVLVHLFREVTQQKEMLRVVQDFARVVSGLAPEPAAGSGNTDPDDTEPVELTRREREILGHLATGAATSEIAQSLGVSPRTVRNHINNILSKLEVHSRLEAVTFSIRNGLV